MFALLLLQASAEDVTREIERLQRNFTFLNSGLWVAWLILVVYVLMMVGRGAQAEARDRRIEGDAGR